MLWKKLNSRAALPVSTNCPGPSTPSEHDADHSSFPSSPVHQTSQSAFQLRVASIMEAEADIWLPNSVKNQSDEAAQLVAIAARACKEASGSALQGLKPEETIFSDSMKSSQVNCSVKGSYILLSTFSALEEGLSLGFCRAPSCVERSMPPSMAQVCHCWLLR